jgi:hydroxyacylglutathione hydrolase
MTFELFLQRTVGPLACNCYIIGDPRTREAIVVDPGGDPNELAGLLAANTLQVVQIVATHAHFDHLIAARELQSLTGAPFRLHADDRTLLDWYSESGRLLLGVELPPPPEVDATLGEGDTLVAGNVQLQVLHTPGHSPGSISLVGETDVLSGDTLFASSIGRSDLPGGDDLILRKTIRGKLFELEDDFHVHPGHGPGTTIGVERKTNPFVGEGSS